MDLYLTMGNANGQCQHSPLDQFDNPCSECPEWQADQGFIFGGGGLMKLLERTNPEKIAKKMRQKRKRELRNKFKCDDCSNAVFSTETEYLEHCSVNYHGKFSVVSN